MTEPPEQIADRIGAFERRSSCKIDHTARMGRECIPSRIIILPLGGLCRVDAVLVFLDREGNGVEKYT